MKLFSTSALIFATTSAMVGNMANGAVSAPTVLEELTMINDRFRRAPTKKQMKRNRSNQADKSPGYKTVEADLQKKHFRNIIRRHGAQAIVNARALSKREQFIMSKILSTKGKLTGRQLLWKLDNTQVDPVDLAQFIAKQEEIMAKAKNEIARNYALYGVDIDNEPADDTEADEPQETDNQSQDQQQEQLNTQQEGQATQGGQSSQPSFSRDPQQGEQEQPAQPPTAATMPRFYEPPFVPAKHPNAHYPAKAFGTIPRSHAQIVQHKPSGFLHPNRNYPAHAFGKIIEPPKIGLKSALGGRGLPSMATRRISNAPNRYQQFDSNHYKMMHLNAMKKEAREWKDALVAQTQKYNELVDMIKAAKMALDADRQADQMLFEASTANARPAMIQTQLNNRQKEINQRNDMMLAKIVSKAREATQAKERFDAVNQANDDLLAKMSAKAAENKDAEEEPVVEKDEIDEAEEAQVDKTKPVQTPPLNAMSFATQYKVALWLKDHDTITYEQYNNIDAEIADPTIEELTSYYYDQQRVLRGDALTKGTEWMIKLKDSIWQGLKPDPVAPQTHHEASNQENDDMLAKVAKEQDEADKKRKKQLWIPPLNTMDFMTQYKVAMWLKDHDELTLQQLNDIEENVPTPKLTELTNYYYAQQKILRRQQPEPENAWMKKLRKTLWKGLKPDPIPQN